MSHQAYPSTAITPSGGRAPYSFQVMGLPAGLTATATNANVTISGTPRKPAPSMSPSPRRVKAAVRAAAATR